MIVPQKRIRIKDRLIGDNAPCFIIAEAGSNHNQRLDYAKRLIDEACRARADAVKFQLFKAELLSADLETRKLLKGYEFKREWIKELADYSRKKEIFFLATPFDYEAVELLDKAGVLLFKISSGDLTNLPLIEYIAKKRKPIILSVGLGNMKEISRALGVIFSCGNNQVVLMHCICDYPARIRDLNLKVVKLLQEGFNTIVGYSDHTEDVSVIPATAVALGAKVIEKHFTLSRKMKGPDHSFAVEPEQLKDMIKSIREAELSLGQARKVVSAGEKKGLIRGRRAIYTSRTIPKGAIITKEMLSVLRPGQGLAPEYLDRVIGKRAKRSMRAYQPISFDKIY